MREIILCGNGGLLQYVSNEIERDGIAHKIMDDISELTWKRKFESSDVILAVSWHETENWIRKLKAVGAKIIYRIPHYAVRAPYSTGRRVYSRYIR